MRFWKSVAALLLCTSGIATAQKTSLPDTPLVLATYAYPRYDRAAVLEPLRKHLEARLKRSVRIAIAATPEALAADIRARRADIAVPNLAAWLSIAGDDDVQPIANLDVPAATRERYRGVLLARADVDIGSQLMSARAAQLRYATVLPGSTSGALVQARHLEKLGISETSFATQTHAGTHDAALSELLAGRVDIAALAEEPWRKLRTDDPAKAGQIVELWRSEPIPPGPILCIRNRHTPCDRIARLLAAADPEALAAARAVAAGWSETEGATRFLAFDRSRYAGVSAP